MARRKSPLSSPTSRRELPISEAPVWELISPGVRLGYRRGERSRGRGGAWLAATRRADGSRVQHKLGLADDERVADGAAVLSCEQAKEAARAWVRRLRTDAPAQSQPVSVNEILDRYLEAKTAEGMKSVYDARSRARVHIRPRFGKMTPAELTRESITRWRDAMAASPKRVRTGLGATEYQTRAIAPDDAEGLRRRRDTANRTLTLLKAALNWARDHDLVESDTAWRLVKPFRGTTAARARFLDLQEQQNLLNTAQGALRDLIAAALMTGARFGELARLTARDVDLSNGSVFIAESKSGKSRHVPLTPGGVALFERLAAGKAPADHLLTRESGEPWGPATYQRGFKEALKRAGIENLTLHELRHSYASTMVRAGAPLIVVAQALGHADARMAERHYAHLARSYVFDVIRQTAPDLRLSKLVKT